MELKSIIEFKWFKISTTIFLGGFFIGYNLSFLDFTWFPFPTLVPYLANKAYFNDYSQSLLLEKLEYIKYTLAEAVIVLAGGVLIGLLTVGALFILGLSIGASLPYILEYAKALTIAQSFIFIALYACSLMFLGASGLSLGASILQLAKNTTWKIDKRAYNSFFLGLIFLIFTIVIEVL